ncbi:FecR domain-containing protein [Chitinophaga sp. 212800010-3]
MGRKVSGEATMGELRELEEILLKDPDLRYKYAVLSNWPATDSAAWEERTNSALEKHMERMNAAPAEELPVRKERRNIRRIVSVLAIMILVLGGYCIYLLINKNPQQNNKAALAAIFTHDGVRSRAQLPDGTEVWLNSGSHLTYHPDMGNLDTREVTLDGEAFFDVAKNTGKPFTIHTSRMNIRVLGTSFNVKAYTQDRITEATLISGAVEVQLNDGVERTIRLLPNQKIILQHAGDAPSTLVAGYSVENIHPNTADSVVAETAWRNNYLVFDNDDFEEVARKIERWYGVKIHLEGKKLKTYRFTATFKNETLPEVMEALKVTTSFHCRIVSNEVFITQ